MYQKPVVTKNIAMQSIIQLTIDSIQHKVFILDESRIILFINKKWRDFAKSEGLNLPNYGVGVDYLNLLYCDKGEFFEDKQRLRKSIQKITSGECESFCIENPCIDSENEKYFLIRGNHFKALSGYKVILIHEKLAFSLSEGNGVLRNQWGDAINEQCSTTIEHLYAPHFKKMLSQAEQEKKEEEILIQKSKLLLINEMIGNIAHQWKQPLNIIASIMQDLPDAYDFEELNRNYIINSTYNIMEQVRYMSQTINDFRSLLKPNKKKGVFSVNKAIIEAISLILYQLRKYEINMIFDCIYEGDIVKEIAEKNFNCRIFNPELFCKGHPNEFKHVVMNIITNSREAIIIKRQQDSGKEVNKDEIVVELNQRKDKVIIKIRDSGGGIQNKDIDSVFMRYFTTKSEGTGIGLYMAKVIIEKNMHGRLYAKNIQNGTEFSIELNYEKHTE